MKILKKQTTDNAVVGVVTAILIIGVIVAVVSLIQTMYIPKIMEQREADHMDTVAEQFTYLTSVINNQAANQIKNMPVATSVTLGSKELPYMLSMKAFGTLKILDNARLITIGSKTYKIGVITYSSANAYFLNQNYTYEAGAMIVSQSEGNLMMIRPSFLLDYNLSNDFPLNITFDVMNIISVGNKTIASGYGTYPIQTAFYNNSSYTFTNVDNITITTSLSNSWYVFLGSSSLYGSQFTLNDTGQVCKIKFSDPNIVKVNFKITNILAQIGPGWVDQRD